MDKLKIVIEQAKGIEQLTKYADKCGKHNSFTISNMERFAPKFENRLKGFFLGEVDLLIKELKVNAKKLA